MLNSFTNFLHATALGIYTYLVYQGLQRGAEHYTTLIFWSFLMIFVLKLLGIIVHLPMVERISPRHEFFWTLIAIGVGFLNWVTLRALNLHPALIAVGMLITLGFLGFYLYTLYTGPGYFFHIALASVLVYLIAALFCRGALRLAWIFIVLSSAAWILLARVPYLLKKKFHNDIYHMALIASTYYLYSTVEMGLWEGNDDLAIPF